MKALTRLFTPALCAAALARAAVPAEERSLRVFNWLGDLTPQTLGDF